MNSRLFSILETIVPSSDLFLNCTKNTELTRAHLSRTVTLALHKNLWMTGRNTVCDFKRNDLRL